MNRQAKAHRLAKLVSENPAALDAALEAAEHASRAVSRGERSYAETHWGSSGHVKPFRTTLPDVARGLVVLGQLVSVHYLAAKGGERVDQWEHDFSAPYPFLTYAKEYGRQGLVIARGRSRYTVTARGIVG